MKNVCIGESMLAILLLVFASPLILVVLILSAIATWESPIFCQKRVGKDLKPFTIFKVKTICSDGYMPVLCKVIRAVRLDELPQLLNVVLGDMVFVGGYRPLIPEHVLALRLSKKSQSEVYCTKPGILGPNQIRPKDQHEKIAVDARYFRRYQHKRGFIFQLLLDTIKFLLLCRTDRHTLSSTPVTIDSRVAQYKKAA